MEPTIRQRYEDLMEALKREPSSRELSLAVTNLEQSAMWYHQGNQGLFDKR